MDVIAANPVTLTHQAQIVELAAKNRLPAMYPWPEFIEIGGLMAYSTNRTEMYRRSAAFVDTIHKGAKPADLPIEQPTKFELVVNLKTARTLALTIPSSPAAGGSGDRIVDRPRGLGPVEGPRSSASAWWESSWLLIVGCATVLAILNGCATSSTAPTIDTRTQAEQCERGGGWWRPNLGVCEVQGTGKQ